MRMRPSLHPLAAATVVAALAGGTGGHYAMPVDAPADRLARNAARYVAAHPDDAHGHYVLGRIHGLAVVLRSRVLASYPPRHGAEGLPRLASDWQSRYWIDAWRRSKPNQPPTEAELLRHLDASITSYEKAIELDPAPPKYHLGLAYVLEEGMPFAHRATVVPRTGNKSPSPATLAGVRGLVAQLGDQRASVREAARKGVHGLLDAAAPLLRPHVESTNEHLAGACRELLAVHWRERAIAEYHEAYRRAITRDRAIETKPISGLRTLVAYEAGNAYARLVKTRGMRDAAETRQVAAVDHDMTALEAKPDSRAITPIIFAVDAPRDLSTLLDPDAVVSFDLDGDGRPSRWPWVRPDTALLVWDPDGQGTVTSGRQLFGSVTWWMFPRDGYHALALLDDDGDGWVAGDEGRGLAAWFDRDTDGVSDPGEVVPLASLGIDALATRALTEVDGCPAHPGGLRLRDGRHLPTYDWIATTTD